MAIACPVDLDTQALRSEVSKVYSRVATDPDGDFHLGSRNTQDHSRQSHVGWVAQRIDALRLTSHNVSGRWEGV